MHHRHSKETIEEAVKTSQTWSDVCRKLGIPPATGSQSHLAKKSKALGIDTSHFVGKSVTKGRVLGPKQPIEYYLVPRSTSKSHWLKLRLYKEGLKFPKCEICGITDWNGKPLGLELDHINGDHWDNTLTNLMIVCPNCHAQKHQK